MGQDAILLKTLEGGRGREGGGGGESHFTMPESKIFVEVFKLTLKCYEGCQLNSGPNLIFY